MHALFISDLHLCPTRPAINTLFEKFLGETAVAADALYILGDLFEYWAGDDDLGDPFHRGITQNLKTVADSGTRLFLLHGNRDFLIGEQFSRDSGISLLPDPTLIDLYGTPTLLMHGDTLCSDDVDYQRFRAEVRQAGWQANFLQTPLAARKAQIEALRQRSQAEKVLKPTEIMDTHPATVAEVLRQYGYPRLIHGHTHRPALHQEKVDGRQCERWVLPDWYEVGGYLYCDASGCSARPVLP